MFTSPDGRYTLFFGVKIKDETTIMLSGRTVLGYEEFEHNESIKVNGEEITPSYYGFKDSGILKEFIMPDTEMGVFMIHAEFTINENGFIEEYGNEAFEKLDMRNAPEFEQAKNILSSFRFER